MQNGTRVRASRLGWAGVKFEFGDDTLLIDPLGNADLWGGPFREQVVDIEIGTPSCSALLTHLHQDHFDPAALAAALAGGGHVFCIEDVAATVASHGLPVRPVRLYQPVEIGAFTAAAVPAVDGFGITQVSWVVVAGEQRFIHCGDTLWHGVWWDIARLFGPFDVAFLPINGFRWLGRNPDADVPTSLTPEEAVAAGRILGAARVVPIHYGLSSDFYREEPNAVERLQRSAAEQGVAVCLARPGAMVDEQI